LPSDDIKVDPATGKVTLPPGEVKDGTDVTATNADEAGSVSDPASGKAPNDDGNTPSEVEVASITGDKAVEGTALTYDVTLNKVPTADTEVTLKLANGSGDVATDLGKEIEVSTDGGNTWTKVTPDADGNFKVTVPAGSTNGIKVQVPTVDDTAVEGDETIRLEGKAAKQADTVVGEGTIVDNDVTGREPPAPTVAQDPDHKGGMVITPADKADKLEVKYTDESDQPQTITVVKDPATGEWKPEGQLPSKDITVDPATGKVTLPPKDVKDGSDVTATNSIGPDSSVPAHGKADSNDVNPNPPQPNEPVVTISGSDKVNEGETATYTVKLDKPADKDVTVTVTLTHKGTEDADFTTAPDATKTLTIKAGETEAKITLEAAKDGKFEGAEHYNLSISNPQGAQLGTETSVDTQIVDVDTPPPPAVDQDPDYKGGMVITPTDGADKLEVKYTDESDQPQTITVVKDPTTGEWKPEGTLPHKDITVDPKTGKVTLPPDAVKDQSDVIAENSGGGKTSEGKGTAGEDDANQPQPVEPKVSISGDENVTEGNSATYKVTLDKPADKDITVTVTLKHGETSDADFSPAPEINKTLTIPAGKTEVEFKLNTVDDKQAEGKETYSLTLSEPKGAQLGDHTSVTTAINDATTPPPAIPQVKSVSSPQAEEGKALVYEVALDAPQADTPVELTLKNGTATLGTDTGKPVEISTDGGNTWTEVTPGSDGKFTATVPAGSENGVKVRVPTVTDTVTEQDETLTLDAATKDQTTPATGTGTITDVPPPSAEVKSVSSPKVAEGEALVFDVAVDKPAADTEVSLTLKGDTATLGTDTGAPIEVSTDGGTTWTPVTPGSDGKFTATVPAGSENGVKVRVPAVKDTETEADETLTLDAATKDQTTPVTGTGTITDVPPPSAEVKSVSSPKVAEGEALVFDVAVDKPAADTEVSLTLKNGTATLGTDTGSPIEVSTDGGTTWTPVTLGSDGKFTATVPAGSENGVKVRVPTVTDTVTEQDETLTLDAATADQTTPATGTGTIT
ncbi:immunoglobulin-like domain-containing protein, partial [Cardiobacterium hominis]